MNAEALIGTVLGTCTLQKLIGQGGMGAVFLAQQSRPRRQVAVKVLLPMVPLNSNQLAAFLERFRRETDAVASLVHPNIVPVHEYGERDGLAYLVMPYISGGTLRDEMEREGPLPLAKVVNYLEQIALALDVAHEHGIIHRDIKPANILMTTEGRLLLTDFGLVKIIDEGRASLPRLTGVGAPVGTPDYMAPEQVIGEDVDIRADLYSLGVILYQMVTGTTPFQGETPMQIAAQHLQIPPPSPQMLRPDLPVAAEQVMLRSLAKRPADRYMHAQDLADAFRETLESTGIYLAPQGGISGATAMRIAALKNLFEPTQQTGKVPAAASNKEQFGRTGRIPAVPDMGDNSGRLNKAGALPKGTMGTTPAARVGGLLSRTGKFPQVGMGGYIPAAVADVTPVASANMPMNIRPADMRQVAPTFMPNADVLVTPGQQGATNNIIKLTGPVKVLKVPVAGQPGRFVTGILPVAPRMPDVANPTLRPWVKVVAFVLAALLILSAVVGVILFVNSHSKPSGQQSAVTGPPNMKATAVAQLTAVAQANIILADPLNQNIHNWPTTPADVYAFKDGAYHITDRGDQGRATVLQANSFAGALGYTLTMQEINGNDNSNNNSFGMIFRFNQQTKNNQVITTFYSFEMVNIQAGEYQLWKYDDTKGATVSSWTEIWHQPFGGEFHQGHGPQSVNTIKVFMDGGKFTFTVDGKMIKTVEDNSLTSGTVGMIVNLNETEVAFKNLLLTHR